MTARTEGAFSGEDFSSAYPPGIEHHFWNKARNYIITASLRKYGVAAGRILEIGCGTGVVVVGLRKMGFDCWGSDLGMAQAAPGAETFLYLGQDCHTLDSSFRESIRTLLLLDVIEHIAEPIAFMASLHKSFPHATTLLVTVPARKELWSNYDDAYGHLRRYNRPMLLQELETAGFRTISMRYFFHALYPLMRLLAGPHKGRNTEIKAPSGWKRIIHKLLAYAFAFEYYLLPGSVVGSSLLAVAQSEGHVKFTERMLENK